MKKKYVLVISFLSAALVVACVFAVNSGRRAERCSLYLSNNNAHAFSELVTALNEMDASLQKSLYVTSPALTGAVCTELFGKAMTAQMSLGVLPGSSQELEPLSSFISRVGDYAFALSRAAAGGQSPTASDREALLHLSDISSTLAANMRSLRADMLSGVLSVDELELAASALPEEASSAPTVSGSLRLIAREFPEMPTLIYDGPFSDHISNSTPKMLEALADIDENAGRDAAAGFLRMGRTRVYPLGECAGPIPCLYYGAELDAGDTVTLAVTRQGGLVLGFLHSRASASQKISIEEALASADSFLSAHGYADMKQTYYMLRDGVLTVNYAYAQGDVLCYPDLVKLSVAMDNGSICGFEASGYISSHCTRSLPSDLPSREESARALPEGVTAESDQLVIIPAADGREILCREFLCSGFGEHKSLIYVGIESGQQEKILLLLEDENGSLTI